MRYTFTEFGIKLYPNHHHFQEATHASSIVLVARALIPVNPLWGPDVAMIVSLPVASLVVGYLFAGKIDEESRRGAIVRIAVLSTVVLMFAILGLLANPYTGTSIRENLESMYATGGWTTTDWLAYSQMLILLLVSMYIVLALALDFVGLYVGSMLRKPKKV